MKSFKDYIKEAERIPNDITDPDYMKKVLKQREAARKHVDDLAAQLRKKEEEKNK